MTRTTIAMATALMVALSGPVGLPTMAQSLSGPLSRDVTSQHHKQLFQLMKDMTEEMGKMTDEMSRDLTPEQRVQMAKRMEAMSSMMRRMSGLEGMPAMMESDWQAQMDQMKKGSSGNRVGRFASATGQGCM